MFLTWSSSSELIQENYMKIANPDAIWYTLLLDRKRARKPISSLPVLACNTELKSSSRRNSDHSDRAHSFSVLILCRILLKNAAIGRDQEPLLSEILQPGFLDPANEDFSLSLSLSLSLRAKIREKSSLHG
jgi:hypothetical protein